MKLKDLDAIERELSSYSIEKHCRFTFDESKSLLRIKYTPSVIHASISRYFDIRLAEKVGQSFGGKPSSERLHLYGSA